MKKHEEIERKSAHFLKSACLALCLAGLGGPAVYADVSYAESTLLTVQMNERSVKDVFDYIEENSEFIFVYHGANIDLNRMVSVDVKNRTVENILHQMFDGTNVEFIINNRQIIVRKKAVSGNPVVLPVGQQDKKISVSGTVKDAAGEPLIGVNVIVKGTTIGNVTDIDGHFTLSDIAPNAILQISYIGYQTVEVPAKANVSVVLKEDSEQLDEVVVMGYGVQKKKLVTGATVQVKGEDMQKLSTNSALGALQSQTPGVQIRQASGLPGEGFKVNVRGIGTIGDSAPLYVIDGIAGGDIDALNPSDIESIDVLKDAASAAIYGARAANGVILVTTKQGKAGKVQIAYDGYVGWQKVSKYPDLLNAREYMEIQDMMQVGDGNQPYDWKSMLPDYIYNSVMDGSWEGTDWMREMCNEGAMTQNHSVNLTGGNETSKFALGLSYTNQEGIFGNPIDPTYERYTVRVNSDHV